jgi:hypothetical protein
MNSSNAQEPFSVPEFAAGTIAVTAIALIAFLGVRVSQPPNLLPANLSQAGSSPATPPTSSAKVSQLRRHAPAVTARARPSLSLDGVIVRESEASGPGSAASSSPTSNPGGTKGSPASDFLIESDPGAIVEMQLPDIRGAPPPLIGPLDLFRMKDAISVQPPKPIREAAIPASPGAERNPSIRSDALWIQTKLRDLGYYAGNTNGVWGLASRNALRDFKIMNGRQEDDKWDQETEQRLLSRQNVRASSTYIGGWAKDIDKCQHLGGSGAPLVIRSRGAETDSGVFRPRAPPKGSRGIPT